MLAVGVDIGTQSLKVVVLGEDGRLLGAAAQPYVVAHPRPQWAEQSARQWEDALIPALSAALAEAGRSKAEVEAIGVSGQLDGCLPIDESGRPSGPCLIWMDRRADDELAAVLASSAIDRDEFRLRTGLVPDAAHMAAKIRWFRSNNIQAARFHQPVSYLVERLCDEFVYDHGLASTTMVYDLGSCDYDDELLELFGIAREELPRIAPAASTAGRLSAQAARWTGLREGITVAVGTGDDFATPMGAGIIEPGTMVGILGTAEVVGAVASRPVVDPRGLLETHGYLGQFFVENPGWLSGGSVSWARALFAIADDAELDRRASEVAAGADGVLFLPALGGAMAPEWQARARGCFYGLASGHHAGHLARAVLEGCAFAMKDVRDRLVELEVLQADAVTMLLGGGAHSELWAQLRADLMGAVVEVPEETDTCPVGAARLAMVAHGVVPDLAALSGGVRIARRHEPRAAERSALEESYARYRLLFDSLRPLWQ